jgi:hypothetical protein
MKSWDEIIESIGQEEFENACADARKLVSDVFTAKSGPSPALAHEISDFIWQSDGESHAKLELTFRFYESMPCYGLLMFLNLNHKTFPAQATNLLWSKYRQYLAEDGVLADCVEYSLWCDFFEDPETVDEAWRALTCDLSSESLVRRVLRSSGPVPFEAKQKVYRQLLPDKHRHEWIFRSLLHSRFDVYGKIDSRRARTILDELELSSDTPHLVLLRDTLLADTN